MSNEKERYGHALTNIGKAIDGVLVAIEHYRITNQMPDKGLNWAVCILEHVKEGQGIKPCPFCGFAPEVNELKNREGKLFYMLCETADCLDVETASFDTLNGAIAAWNKRVI